MNRRKPHFDDYAAALADAERLLAGGYDRAGNWSLGQIATHLAIVAEMARAGFPWYVPWPLYLPVRWLALPSVLRRDVFTVRLSGPKFAAPPDAVEDRAGVERLRAALAALDGSAERFFPSPIFGPLTREQWRQVTLWHLEHHLSFLVPKPA
ncbi:MAG: DUF1569 domain-containing protein [Gemmataceae bacterium]